MSADEADVQVARGRVALVGLAHREVGPAGVARVRARLLVAERAQHDAVEALGRLAVGGADGHPVEHASDYAQGNREISPAAQPDPPAPGIQLVPASGTRAIAAASTVSATRSSGSRLCTCDLPHARASVWVSSVSVRR